MTIWRILIPTLPERDRLSVHLFNILESSAAIINRVGEDLRVDIMIDSDPLLPIGAKRQSMLEAAHQAGANYVSFIDDDDIVSLDYIPRIADALTTAKPDVVGFYGLAVNMLGDDPRDAHLFVHSARLSGWSTENGLRIRTPNHLNPIRTAIALAAGYAPLSYGEDMDYSQRLAETGLIQTEAFIPHVLYTYRINMFKRWQAERGVNMDG